MTGVTAFKALAIWFGILILAIANGVLREAVLMPRLGAPAALVASGLVLCAAIFGVTWLVLPWLAVRRAAHRWAIGIGWLLLTLVFEFSFGLWQGKSWSMLVQAYTFKGGNLWPVVLAVTALSPYLAGRIRGWT